MFSMRQFWCLVGAGLVVMVAVGCGPKKPVTVEPEPTNYWEELPPGEKALVKLEPAEYPDFSEGFMYMKHLELAAEYSLEYLSKPSSQQRFPYLDVSHERAVATLEAFIDLARTVRSGEELNRAIDERFEVYMSRGCDEEGTVLYTGYYRPIFDARLKPDAVFKYPLYKRPDDLERDEARGIYQRKGGGTYYTRAEIDNGALAGRGLELSYLRDRFEAYIVTVQGSGRLRLADGSFYDIGYHGDNGHEYSSVGQTLVDKGLIRPSDLSLQGLIGFFKAHPEQLDGALAVNDRYVFFLHRDGGEPIGSLNVPVTPFKSIATDKEVYPSACVAFLDTRVPGRDTAGGIMEYRFRGFAMDQDTGGAIRAAGRCDFFLGTGPRIGELAGRAYAEGKLYYIFVKPEYANLGAAVPAEP